MHHEIDEIIIKTIISA